ncbi:uncharacterized protein LOC119668893 [Teleopsis dalmanni]|uniref:uncharacterized protein LOC119668893 n=1 Tax=Teleopsis dalmanni TaxID=139649 RepID=UPI0018CF9164|nr:uncharacterized protein LOC119668893 [Teleopsis dalmanni]
MSLSSPNTAPMTSLRFWILTVGLLALWTVVITSAESQPQTAKSAMAIVDKEKEQKNTRNCKALCGHCGCIGFYCGEECICECNKENSDTECLVTMQKNARKLNIPFELLIQGPTANKFVRTALQYEQNAESKAKNRDSIRNKRSTVVIYKPTFQNSLDDNSAQKSIVKKKLKNMREKRSVGRLDWFQDFANTLVRPAPIGIHKKTAEPEPSEDQTMLKRSTEKLDSSWFAENTKNLLKPAPLFKNRNSDDDDESFESPGEKIPKMLQDTLRSIHETARSEQFAEAVRSRIKEGVDIFQDQLQRNNLNILPNNLGENIVDTISNVRSNIFRNVIDGQTKPTIPTPTEPPVKYIIPWFRPMRFLHRVQQAIK